PVGELDVAPANGAALSAALADALERGRGMVRVASAGSRGEELFSTERSCSSCGRSFEPLDPRLFSYNSRYGWCESCYGTGVRLQGFDEEQTGEEAWWAEAEAEPEVCEDCGGERLRPEARAVRFAGASIGELTALSVREARERFAKLALGEREREIARDVLPEIESRLGFLEIVGLDYLSLDRAAPTLSGGEAQRIRLAAQLGSNLRGVCYILDEPTIGLHPRDNGRLLDTIGRLAAKGNTIVVVEHDEDTIRRAEHVIDLGPGAGRLGGEVVAAGSLDQLLANPDSITGRYLAQPLPHPLRGERRPPAERWLRLRGAVLHNLKGIDVEFALGRLNCVTGVSGSGKSSLVHGVLHTNLKHLLDSKGKAALNGCSKLEGWQEVQRVLEVDQTPIGK